MQITINPNRKSGPLVQLEGLMPVEYDAKDLNKRLAVFDCETDPFMIDPTTGKARNIAPFTCGFYDGESYVDFWGPDCIHQFFVYLDSRSDERFCIVAHNGGNFDFYFMVDEIDPGSSPFIMDGRLVRMECHGQEFRDSYKLIPVALGEYQKTPMNYAKMCRDWFEKIEGHEEAWKWYAGERHSFEWLSGTEEGERRAQATYSPREHFKDEIRSYQKDDCVFLYELVSAAYDEFGDKLTMASVALPKLRSFHGFNTMGEATDALLRPYYFGGRCEAFEVGELTPREAEHWSIYDVNSMYPYVMSAYKHPVSSVPVREARITKNTHFARINATSDGALPMRKDDGSLFFPRGRFDFYASIHEIKAGQELGLLRIHKVYESFYFLAESSFADFVYHFYNRRLEADANGDKIRKLFWKLVLNSSYGKFAQDPRKYETFLFDPPEMPTPFWCEACDALGLEGDDLCETCKSKRSAPDGWRPHVIRNGKTTFARPQTRARHSSFYNVATAASITAAARAELLRGIANASRPIYCDTDSLICEAFSGQCDPKRLGAWKLEATGTHAFIAGKKLYAVMDGGADGVKVKTASKGVKLTAEQIARVSRGEVVHYAHEVPKFNLDGSFKTTERTIQRTVA